MSRLAPEGVVGVCVCVEEVLREMRKMVDRWFLFQAGTRDYIRIAFVVEVELGDGNGEFPGVAAEVVVRWR